MFCSIRVDNARARDMNGWYYRNTTEMPVNESAERSVDSHILNNILAT